MRINPQSRVADALHVGIGILLTLSVLLALPMLFSRGFPTGGTFPAEDSVFFFMAMGQAIIALSVLAIFVLLRLMGRVWTIMPFQLLIPPLVVLAIAANKAFLFPEFILLAIATLVLIGATALEIKPAERTRAIAPASGEGKHHETEESAASADFPAIRPGKTFKDVVGMAEVKERLLAAGQEIVGQKKVAGADRNGILLFSEPGNGKTLLAEALAGELGIPIITATFGDVVSRWVGQTTEQVVAAFRAAREQQPCLLFLDEIDSLIKDRNQSMGGSDEAAKTTNAILTELVNARRSKIVIVAATNFLDKLDQAAIREGRFDFKIEIPPPDEPARKAILQHALKPFKGLVADEEAIAMAAKRWEGFSAVRIRTVGDEAGRAAMAEGIPLVVYEDLQDALRRIQGRSGRLPPGTQSLKDLTMPDSLARQLRGIANRMRKIEQIEAMGSKVPTGLLFGGPPGTGKSVTARALAKDSGWAFISTTGNELLSDPSRIDTIVREARDIRPSVIFIDEADDVLADRQYARHTASVTNRLLAAIDGSGGKVHDIVWIAATNHPDQMDSAALRGGRFTVKVEFDLPDLNTLEMFVDKWIAQTTATFDPTANGQTTAPLLLGQSIANVGAILQHAVDTMVESVMEEEGPDGEEAPLDSAVVNISHVQRAIRAITG